MRPRRPQGEFGTGSGTPGKIKRIAKPYEDKIMKIAKDKRKEEIKKMFEDMYKKIEKKKKHQALSDIYKKARDRKPTGRMSMDDLKNASQMKKGGAASRMPMQTGPRKITDRDRSRIMKPLPVTPDLKRKLKDRDMKPLPITPKDRERMKNRIMTPLKKGGAAKRGYGKAKR